MSQPENNWFIIVSGTAAVYKEANFNSPCITEAVYGESCRILNQKNNWLCVKCEDDCEGWVNTFYGNLSPEKIIQLIEWFFQTRVGYTIQNILLVQK